MNSTHKFPLVTGPMCVVKELTGKHQRLLSEQKDKIGEGLTEVLLDVVLSIGSQTTFDKDFFEKKLLTADKKKILVEVRQFTMDHDPSFKFKYEYVNEQKESKEYEHDVDLSEGFPERPYNNVEMVAGEKEGELVEQLTPIKVMEYSELDVYRKYRIVLPKSGKVVQLTRLDGFGETIGATTKKKERSTHTPIVMRHPQEIIQSEDKKDLPIVLNLDGLAIKDIEAIRTAIKKHEGQVDTEIKFEHPEAESRQEAEKYVTVDLVQQLAFFFPSQAI